MENEKTTSAPPSWLEEVLRTLGLEWDAREGALDDLPLGFI